MIFMHANKFISIRAAIIATLLVACNMGSAFADGKFDNFDVRVIKNKYFQKRFRPEFELGFGAIMNKTFTNTALGGGRLTFHLSETWALSGEGHYGVSFRSNDCKVLGSKFEIEPLIDTMKWWAGGGLAYTPVYGKFQIPTGQVIYFDWFFTVGAGTAQIEHKEVNTCFEGATAPQVDGNNNEIDPTENDVIKNRLLIHYGTGQRYFLNESFSLNWHFRLMNVQPTSNENAISAFTSQPSVVLGMGASYYL